MVSGRVPNHFQSRCICISCEFLLQFCRHSLKKQILWKSQSRVRFFIDQGMLHPKISCCLVPGPTLVCRILAGGFHAFSRDAMGTVVVHVELADEALYLSRCRNSMKHCCTSRSRMHVHGCPKKHMFIYIHKLRDRKHNACSIPCQRTSQSFVSGSWCRAWHWRSCLPMKLCICHRKHSWKVTGNW